MNIPYRWVPYRWVIVAAGGLMGCIAIGSMFSLPVFLTPIAEATGWSRTGLSAAMTINFLALAIAGFGWGVLVDRFGPKPVVLSGAVLLGLGIALASRSHSLLEFQLVYGLLVGAGAGAIFAPLMATVTGWFDTQRSLAVSLVSAGMGIAPMTVAPFAARLVSVYDWRTSQLVIAILAWAVLLPTALLVRRAPVTAPGGAAGGGAPADDPTLTATAALRSPQFIVLALTYFFCCATHSGPIFHTVSYAISCGLPALAAVSIYSVEGLAGLGGRLLFGILGDRFGAKPVLIAGLLVQALGAAAYFFVRELGAFYAVAAVFGLAYAGVMPLYAVIARENFPMHVMGTVFGAATMASSLGMALGPLAGGWIFDTYASYGW
ncbi:MAG TPA: MFS transporter, partial [Rhodopila sp.]